MMYTITRGPSKLATQRRIGPTQQVESKAAELKGRQPPPAAWPPSRFISRVGPFRFTAQISATELVSSPIPKLVFNRVNGKRPQVTTQLTTATEESYTLAHEENVRFVYEAWQQVEQQLDDSQSEEDGRGPVQYVEKTPNPALTNFVPIDLEQWWGEQFLAKLKNCS